MECLGGLIIHQTKSGRQTQNFSVQNMPKDEITRLSKHQAKITPFQLVSYYLQLLIIVERIYS